MFLYKDVPLVEFKYFVFTRIPGGDTVGDSAHCCCVACLLSAIHFSLFTDFLHNSIGLILFSITTIHSEANM